jgi:hypothetical protein
MWGAGPILAGEGQNAVRLKPIVDEDSKNRYVIATRLRVL